MASPLDVHKINHFPKDLSTSISLFEDRSQSRPFTDIQALPNSQWQQSTQHNINYGFTDSAYWLRIELFNGGAISKHLKLEQAYPLIDHVLFYFPKRSFSADINENYNRLHTGESLPFSTRKILHRHFLFDIDIPPQTQRTFYLRLSGRDLLKINPMLWDKESYAAYDHHYQMIYGLFFGAILLLIVLNLLLYFGLNDKSYLYYTLTLTSFCIITANHSGLTFEYIHPDLPSINKVSRPSLTFIYNGFLCLFSITYLDLARNAPKLKSLLQQLTKASFLLALITIPLPYYLSYSISILGALILAVIILLIALHEIRKKNKSARFYFLAYGSSCIGTAISLLTYFSLLPTTTFTNFSIQLGTLLFALILSLGLGYRINAERKAKMKSQARSILQERVAKMELERSHKRQKEAQKKESKAEAIALAAMKESTIREQFIATMRHELKRPIIDSQYIFNALSHTHLNNSQHHHINILSNLLLSLDTTIKDILGFSMARAEKFNINKTECNLNTVLDEITSISQLKCKNSNVSFTSSISPNINHPLWEDPIRLRQLIHTLIDNALAVTNEGHIQLNITHIQKSHRALIKYEISDTGKNIPLDLMNDIFSIEKANEIRPPLANEQPRKGLYFCHKLVMQMGGNLNVQHNPPQGSTFWFTLPCLSENPQLIKKAQ